MSGRAIVSKIVWPFKTFANAYCRAAEKRPFAVGVITTGVKTSCADLFAQKVMEKREDIDWTRQAAFTFFGFAYLGGFQYAFYTRVLGPLAHPITKSMGHIASAPFKTFIDQAIHHPFFYFPAFYYLKYTLVKGEEPEVAYEKYRDELWINCTALWTIWVPAQLLNFSVVPRYLQIPYAAAVSFVWTIVLSTMRGAFDDKKEFANDVETDEQGHPDIHRTDDDTHKAASPSSCIENIENKVDNPDPSLAIACPLERFHPHLFQPMSTNTPTPPSHSIRDITVHAASTTSALLALQHPLTCDANLVSKQSP